MICSKFITFAVTKTTVFIFRKKIFGCDLLKIHYLCGNKDNIKFVIANITHVVICSKFITFAVTKTTYDCDNGLSGGCDLLKIHYLCGNKDNSVSLEASTALVVICSKFITFAVTKTT